MISCMVLSWAALNGPNTAPVQVPGVGRAATDPCVSAEHITAALRPMAPFCSGIAWRRWPATIILIAARSIGTEVWAIPVAALLSGRPARSARAERSSLAPASAAAVSAVTARATAAALRAVGAISTAAAPIALGRRRLAFLARGIDDKRAPIKARPAQSDHCALGADFIPDHHNRKPARLASRSVDGQRHILNLRVAGEEQSNCVLRCGGIQIPDKDLVHISPAASRRHLQCESGGRYHLSQPRRVPSYPLFQFCMVDGRQNPNEPSGRTAIHRLGHLGLVGGLHHFKRPQD